MTERAPTKNVEEDGRTAIAGALLENAKAMRAQGEALGEQARTLHALDLATRANGRTLETLRTEQGEMKDELRAITLHLGVVLPKMRGELLSLHEDASRWRGARDWLSQTAKRHKVTAAAAWIACLQVIIYAAHRLLEQITAALP